MKRDLALDTNIDPIDKLTPRTICAFPEDKSKCQFSKISIFGIAVVRELQVGAPEPERRITSKVRLSGTWSDRLISSVARQAWTG